MGCDTIIYIMFGHVLSWVLATEGMSCMFVQIVSKYTLLYIYA